MLLRLLVRAILSRVGTLSPAMDGIPENYQQYYKLDPSSAKA